MLFRAQLKNTLIDIEPGGLQLASPLSTSLMRLLEMHEYCKLHSAFINGFASTAQCEYHARRSAYFSSEHRSSWAAKRKRYACADGLRTFQRGRHGSMEKFSRLSVLFFFFRAPLRCMKGPCVQWASLFLWKGHNMYALRSVCSISIAAYLYMLQYKGLHVN